MAPFERVLWIGGPSGAGKSTAAWLLARLHLDLRAVADVGGVLAQLRVGDAAANPLPLPLKYGLDRGQRLVPVAPAQGVEHALVVLGDVTQGSLDGLIQLALKVLVELEAAHQTDCLIVVFG